MTIKKCYLPKNLVTIFHSKRDMILHYLMNQHFKSDFGIFYNMLLESHLFIECGGKNVQRNVVGFEYA